MDQRCGFFVKIREDCYRGPFVRLNEARDEARRIGPDLEIYHGVIKYVNDQIVDTEELSLVPKVIKNAGF
jgi:hypothetical protein